MKSILLYSLLLIGFLFSCNNQTELLLQEDEISIHNEPTEFEFSETTTGTISFDYYINSGFVGSLLFQNQEELLFEYQINTFYLFEFILFG